MNNRKKINEFDVALSFAGEDRKYVEETAMFLKNYGVNVFYDKFEENKLWGKDLYDYLSEIYKKRTNYVVMFVSRNYIKKPFPKLERRAAQSGALKKNREYILPVNLDDTKIPESLSTIAYIDGSKKTPKQLASLIIRKIGCQTKKRWWGKWKLESLLKCLSGTLFIEKVHNDRFHFKLNVINGSHIGEVIGKAEFMSDNEAIYKKDNCTLTFLKFNDMIQINEKIPSECPHGLRAYFGGNYHIQKDIFWVLDDVIDDIMLSKIWEILGEEYWDSFIKCFGGISEDENLDSFNAKVISGGVPGLYTFYEAILMVSSSKEIWGAFLDCDNIYYFTSEKEWEKKLPKTIKKWKEHFNKDIIFLSKLSKEEKIKDVKRKQKEEKEIIDLSKLLSGIVFKDLDIDNDTSRSEKLAKLKEGYQKLEEILKNK